MKMMMVLMQPPPSFFAPQPAASALSSPRMLQLPLFT
jgi:hypothetical protein